MHKRSLFSAVVIGAAMLVSGCGDTSELYFGKGEHAPLRTISIAEARREAIALELELYNLLEKEFGIGNWEAPPPTGIPQARPSPLECDPDGTSERWSLAYSTSVPKDNWGELTERVGKFLAPRGFGSAALTDISDGTHTAKYTNPTTGVRVEIGFNTTTAIRVDTGCVDATLFQDWPDGAEGVPAHLRTSGRGPYHLDQEIWPDQTPDAAPEGSSPSATLSDKASDGAENAAS